MTAQETPSRYQLLDTLRGLCLLSMVAYHGMYDLVDIFGLPSSWYWGRPGYLWQQSICWTFILLSGMCWQLAEHQPFKPQASPGNVPGDKKQQQCPEKTGPRGELLKGFVKGDHQQGAQTQQV